jgi:hypothetical protein
MQQLIKKGAKVAGTVTVLRNPLTWIAAGVVFLLASIVGFALIIAISMGGDDSFDSGEGVVPGNIEVSKNVLRFQPLVEKDAKEQGISQYINVLLALIQQESGGTQLDVMQASESQGLAPGAIMDPEYSIQVGVKYFSTLLKQAKGNVNLALQAYNFGSGFISYAKHHGGYSIETAMAFSHQMAEKNGWAAYGDVHYVQHVLRYTHGGKGSKGDGSQVFDVKKVENIMKQFLGRPYLWGGRNPKDGGFDCSGLFEYAFGQVGIDLKGTAEAQFDKTKAVPEDKAQPGDLVFFSTYKAGASHVGMYVGNGQFLNANGKGILYSSVTKWKKLYPFLGYRRVQ